MLYERPGGFWRRLLPILLTVCLGMALGMWHNSAVSRGANDPITVALRTVLTPIIAATDAVADWFSSTSRSLFRGGELARENQRLRRKLAELTEEVENLREARERVDRLEEFARFVAAGPRRKLPARIIGLGMHEEFGTLVIGIGSGKGCRANDVVVTPEGLLGCLYDVAPTSSVVLLITDPRSSVGARVRRAESRAVGICRGMGRRELRCTYLSREADVKVGDVMVTSGLGGPKGIYPPGIVIGTVTSVQENLAMSAKTAIVRAAVDVASLEEVAVLR